MALVLGLNRVVCRAGWLSWFARDRVRTLNRAARLHTLVRENEVGGFALFSTSSRRDVLSFCTIDDQVWVQTLWS